MFTVCLWYCIGQEDTKHGREDTPRTSGGLQRSPSVHDGAQRHPALLSRRERVENWSTLVKEKRLLCHLALETGGGAAWEIVRTPSAVKLYLKAEDG